MSSTSTSMTLIILEAKGEAEEKAAVNLGVHPVAVALAANALGPEPHV